jgi:hypothetical protein
VPAGTGLDDCSNSSNSSQGRVGEGVRFCTDLANDRNNRVCQSRGRQGLRLHALVAADRVGIPAAAAVYAHDNSWMTATAIHVCFQQLNRKLEDVGGHMWDAASITPRG